MNNSDVMPKFSLVIPAFQEGDIIDSTLVALRTYLDETGRYSDTEVVVVAADGGDDTAKIARTHDKNFSFFQVIEPGPKVGKGRDVREGMLAARGEYIIFTDADLALPIEYATAAFEKLENSYDVVIARRDFSTSHSKLRMLLSKSTNLLTRIVILPGIHDTQCGFKGFRRQAAHTLFELSSIHGWSFDIEILALARKHNFTIGEVTIEHWGDTLPNAGIVGENPLAAIFRSLYELAVIRWRFWTGYYNRKRS